MEEGYRKTSYSDIAARSGASRPLVQYYFPKKELIAQTCSKALVAAAQDVAQERVPSGCAKVGTVYVWWQIVMASWFLRKGSRLFLRDLLCDRGLSQAIIFQNYRLAAHVLTAETSGSVKLSDASIMVAGGIGELMYFYLMSDKTPDISSMLALSVTAQASALGLVDGHMLQEGWAGLEPYALTNEALAPLAVQAIDHARETLLGQGTDVPGSRG